MHHIVHHALHHAVHCAVHHIPKCASLAQHCHNAPSRGGQVPYVDPGQTYKVQVKSSMKKAKSASGFYSFRCDSAAANPPCAQGTPPAHARGANPDCLCACRSIFAGMKNNIVGMFGFLREGRKSQSRCRRRGSSVATTRACPGPRCRARAPPPPPAPAVLLGTVDVYADRFEERIGGEDELMKLVAKKKAAKAAAAAAGLKSR